MERVKNVFDLAKEMAKKSSPKDGYKGDDLILYSPFFINRTLSMIKDKRYVLIINNTVNKSGFASDKDLHFKLLNTLLPASNGLGVGDYIKKEPKKVQTEKEKRRQENIAFYAKLNQISIKEANELCANFDIKLPDDQGKPI